MFKKKWLLFTLLGLIVVFTVAACSQNETNTEKATEEATETGQLIVSGDTVAEQGCVLASRFSAGDKIVFRMNAVDGRTNEQVTDAKLQVHLSTGETLDMEYGEHGEDMFWVAAYPVTEETPTGTLEYYVTAKAGNQEAEFHPFNVAPSLLTIVDSEEVETSTEKEPAEEEADSSSVETTDTMDIVATNFDFNQDAWYVKAGEEVTVNLTSEEGVHGIAIKGQDVSIDEANGSTTFTPTEAGEYEIVCSIFCGEGHGDMVSKLVVVGDGD